MNINRGYICDNEKCNHYFEIVQERDEPLLKRCPKCRKHKLYQDLSGQHISIIGEPKTLIHQADRNTKNFGKYELEDKRKKDAYEKKLMRKKPLIEKGLIPEDAMEKERKPAWYGELPKEKAKDIMSNKKRAKKYIQEGK